MKLSNTIWFLAAATAGYKLYENKDKLIQEFSETGESVSRAQESLERIKSNITILQEQLGNAQSIGQDLAYKVQLLNQEVQSRTQVIQDIWQTWEK